MRDLAEQLRDYTASAAPVTLSEVTTKGRYRHRLGLILVAAAVCAVLAFAGLVATRSAMTSNQVRTRTVPRLEQPCTVSPGCPMERGDASARLGFAVMLPRYVPSGWVRPFAKLRVYPPHSQVNGTPDHTVLVYGVIWTPPGTDLFGKGCPDMLSVRQRRVDRDIPGNTDLGDGLRVSGSVGPSVCGDPSGRTAVFAHFNWIAHGVYFRLTATGLDRDEVVRVIRSFGG